MEKRYEFIDVLAAALYGEVHRLRDRITGDLVVLKRVELKYAAQHRSKQSNSIVEEDIFTELQINMEIRKLGGHPNIVSMKDCFLDGNIAGLISEYCATGELLHVVNTNGGRLPMDQTLRYFQQVLAGVSFLHRHYIAHRDLSLENILLDRHHICKISDFGLATKAPSVNASGTGKVVYLAPEATQRGACYNPIQADLWSLGVLLFTLIVGQYPFQSAQKCDPHFRLLSTLGLEYLLERCEFDTRQHRDVFDLLKRLLAVDPCKRFSAQSLLSHPCFDHLASEARQPEPVGPVENPEEGEFAVLDKTKQKTSANNTSRMSAGSNQELASPELLKPSRSSGFKVTPMFTHAFSTPTSSMLRHEARRASTSCMREQFTIQKESSKTSVKSRFRDVLDGVFGRK